MHTNGSVETVACGHAVLLVALVFLLVIIQVATPFTALARGTMESR